MLQNQYNQQIRRFLLASQVYSYACLKRAYFKEHLKKKLYFIRYFHLDTRIWKCSEITEYHRIYKPPCTWLRFFSVCVARKKTGRRRRWTAHRVKEEDTCVRAMAVEEEEEKDRRKAGGEEEREKIDRGKDELSIAVHECVGIVRHLLRENGELINGMQRTSEKKRIRLQNVTNIDFFFFKINCIKVLVCNSHHVWHQSCSYDEYACLRAARIIRS